MGKFCIYDTLENHGRPWARTDGRTDGRAGGRAGGLTDGRTGGRTGGLMGRAVHLLEFIGNAFDADNDGTVMLHEFIFTMQEGQSAASFCWIISHSSFSKHWAGQSSLVLLIRPCDFAIIR